MCVYVYVCTCAALYGRPGTVRPQRERFLFSSPARARVQSRFSIYVGLTYAHARAPPEIEREERGEKEPRTDSVALLLNLLIYGTFYRELLRVHEERCAGFLGRGSSFPMHRR